MSSSFQEKTDSDCFKLFTKSPKTVSIEVVKGAHKFVAKTIQNGDLHPTIQELIQIFAHFTQGKIKDYIFTRMTRPILLELALCIIQEIVLNGVGRAKTLHLEVVKSKAGGKSVQIADPFSAEGHADDDSLLEQIDEAYFRLLDSEGNSPNVDFAAGQGHGAPYSPFAKDGAFIRPKPPAARSLASSIEVRLFYSLAP